VCPRDILAAFGIRKNFTDQQLQYLNSFFTNVSQYPSKEQKEKLSLDIDLSFKQVSMWFENRRRKKK